MSGTAISGLLAAPRALVFASAVLFSQTACGSDTLNPDGLAATVQLSSQTLNLSVGDTLSLTAKVLAAGGSVLATKRVTWSTSDPSIVTISGTGVVTAVAVGNAALSAAVDTAKATIPVNVGPTTTVQPELPRVSLNTAMPAVTGKSISVPAGGDLQAAINQAVPGDEIVLQAGATYTGNYNLPVKSGAGTTPGTGPVIIIRSSGIASLPAGTRVSPADTVNMARVVTNTQGVEVFGTTAGTAGWRLVGLEITATPSVTTLGRLVRFGDGNPTQNALSQVPLNLILDRSYVHGTPTLDIRRCVDLQSGATAIIDSYISACHSAGSDAQAICGWNGPGPYKIQNNYLEGSGENVMIGGADPSIPNVVPADIEVRGNYFFKPLTWQAWSPTYAGTPWSIKNLFELKIGRRILIENNVFEQVWTDAQAGFALLLKTNNTAGLVTSDVTVRNNIINGAAGGVNVAGVAADGTTGAPVIERVAVTNNLFLDIGSGKWDPGAQNGRLFQWFNALDLTIAHNTGFAPAMFASLDLPVSPRLTFKNNVVGHGVYGFRGSGFTEGTATLEAYTRPYSFAGNVIVAGGDPSLYPAQNFFASTLGSVGFVDPVSNNYALGAGSTYAGKGTDGTDPGINATALATATSGVKP